MFRMSFDKKLVENVEEHSLSVFMYVHVLGLRTQLVFICTHTHSCVRCCVNLYASMFFSSYKRMFQDVYTCMDHAHTCANLCAYAGT